MSSILFGDTIFEEPKCSTPDSHDRLTSVNNNTMVPSIESDYIFRLGIVFYIRNIILLGSTTKKTLDWALSMYYMPT